MTHDRVKNKGYGTQAERLAVQYAFEQMDMEMVLADCLEKNARSQHVLGKVGFELASQSQGCRLYRMTKERYLQGMKARQEAKEETLIERP